MVYHIKFFMRIISDFLQHQFLINIWVSGSLSLKINDDSYIVYMHFIYQYVLDQKLKLRIFFKYVLSNLQVTIINLLHVNIDTFLLKITMFIKAKKISKKIGITLHFFNFFYVWLNLTARFFYLHLCLICYACCFS